MPNYQKLYYQMFRANEQALRILRDAQQAAEEAFLAEPLPPLTLRPQQPSEPESYT